MNAFNYLRIIDELINKFTRYFFSIKGKSYYVFLKEYSPFILTFFFIVYIVYSLSKSEIKSFDVNNLNFLWSFFFYSFSITPLFLIFSSIRFNLIKILFNIKTTLNNHYNLCLLHQVLMPLLQPK